MVAIFHMLSQSEILDLFRQTNALLYLGTRAGRARAPTTYETFDADKLPPDLAGTPAVKPGSGPAPV